jgi:hypothetical protein
MKNLKEVEVVLTKVCTFLDLTYYSLHIRFWDNDRLVLNNLASFHFYDAFAEVIKTLDAMNQQFQIKLYIFNNPEVKTDILSIVNMDGRAKALKRLAGTQKNQKTLAEFLKFHSVEIL